MNSPEKKLVLSGFAHFGASVFVCGFIAAISALIQFGPHLTLCISTIAFFSVTAIFIGLLSEREEQLGVALSFIFLLLCSCSGLLAR